MRQAVGVRASQSNGWFTAHKYLILRRISQILILTLFMIGPIFGVWIIKGNLSSSLLLETIPMTDPFVLLQSLLAGHLPELTALLGAIIIIIGYFVVGGRVFCSWVCPVNLTTDAANWLRRKLKIRTSTKLSPNIRWYLLLLSLILPLVSGVMMWEQINPVSLFHRGLIFSLGFGWMLVAAIFLFDFLLVERGWCGHICPMGAFYNLLGRKSPLRISAIERDKCDKCMDCFAVCPEPQILKGPLFGKAKGFGSLIDSGDCTNCGRCIDVCSENVFKITTRFAKKAE